MVWGNLNPVCQKAGKSVIVPNQLGTQKKQGGWGGKTHPKISVRPRRAAVSCLPPCRICTERRILHRTPVSSAFYYEDTGISVKDPLRSEQELEPIYPRIGTEPYQNPVPLGTRYPNQPYQPLGKLYPHNQVDKRMACAHSDRIQPPRSTRPRW